MSSILKISEAANIAIQSVIMLARFEITDQFLNVTEIAKAIGASKHHIAKVMQRLSKEGYIKSLRGPTGGFKLAKHPSQITLLELYEVVEGKVTPFSNRKIDITKPLFTIMTTKINNVFLNTMRNKFISDYIK